MRAPARLVLTHALSSPSPLPMMNAEHSDLDSLPTFYLEINGSEFHFKENKERSTKVI